MLDQNCPECDSVPETMQALKLYWKSLKRNSDKHPVLVFYASSTNPTLDEGTTMSCPYNQVFLTVLSKFSSVICVITKQPIERSPPQLFTPSHAITDVVEWIQVMVEHK